MADTQRSQYSQRSTARSQRSLVYVKGQGVVVQAPSPPKAVEAHKSRDPSLRARPPSPSGPSGGGSFHSAKAEALNEAMAEQALAAIQKQASAKNASRVAAGGLSLSFTKSFKHALMSPRPDALYDDDDDDDFSSDEELVNISTPPTPEPGAPDAARGQPASGAPSLAAEAAEAAAAVPSGQGGSAPAALPPEEQAGAPSGSVVVQGIEVEDLDIDAVRNAVIETREVAIRAAAAASRRRAAKIGLLGPLQDAKVDSDETIVRAVAWCSKMAVVSLSDVIQKDWINRFIGSLQLKPLQARKMHGLLQAPTASLASALSYRQFETEEGAEGIWDPDLEIDVISAWKDYDVRISRPAKPWYLHAPQGVKATRTGERTARTRAAKAKVKARAQAQARAMAAAKVAEAKVSMLAREQSESRARVAAARAELAGARKAWEHARARSQRERSSEGARQESFQNVLSAQQEVFCLDMHMPRPGSQKVRQRVELRLAPATPPPAAAARTEGAWW
jgi:hypothetical protein